jgi:hypothetical protein
LEFYGHVVADVRAAIDWLLRWDDLKTQGISFTSQSSPLWFAFDLMEEYRGLAERALEVMMRDGKRKNPVTRMQLDTWLAAATFNTLGPVPQVLASYTKALAGAKKLKNRGYQLYALWGLAAYHIAAGGYDEVLRFSRQFSLLTEMFDDVASRLIRDRLMSAALCYGGQLAEARTFAERALETPPLPVRSINGRFHGFDHHMASRLHLPRILWLQGFPDRAALLVREGRRKGTFSSLLASVVLSYRLCGVSGCALVRRFAGG